MDCKSGKSETRFNFRSRSSSPSTMRLLVWLLSGALLIVAVSDCVNGVSLGGEEEAVEEGNDIPVPPRALEVASPFLPGRVKRSREVHQLCGYRLLDALRSVCDRNFVGFTRRTDPSLFLHPGGDGQSGEEIQVFGNDPWETLGMEYHPSFVTGDLPHYTFPSTTAISPQTNFNGMGGNLLDYLELLQQPPSPTWFRNGGAGGAGSGSSTKSFALKMLAEPPKTHQRLKRSIIDECCKKPCAMGQMLKYCAITGVGKRGVN